MVGPAAELEPRTLELLERSGHTCARARDLAGALAALERGEVDAVFRNPADLLRLEEASRSAQHRHHLHLAQTPLAVLEWDPEGRVTAWNPAAERMFGYSAGEVLGRPIIDLVTPRDPGVRSRVERIAQYLVQEREPSYPLHENVRKDGSVILCQWFNTPLKDEQGNPIGVASMALDVTDRIRTQEHLRSSERRLGLVLDQTPLATLEWDLSGRVTRWNPAAERIFGYTEAEALGRIGYLFLAPEPDASPRLADVYGYVLDAHGGSRTITTNRRKDGRVIVCEWFSTALKDDSGHVVGLASQVLDITQQKEAEAAAERERRRQEVLNRTAQTVNRVLDPQVILRTLVESAMELVQARAGAAGLVEGDRLPIREFRTQDGWEPLGLDLARGQGGAGQAWATGQAFRSDEAGADPRLDPAMQARLGCQTVLAVPILGRDGTCLGGLELYDPPPSHEVDSLDLALLQGLTASGAVALENARLLEARRLDGQRLAAARDNYRTLLMALPLLVWKGDASGGCEYVNQTWLDFTGLPQASLLGDQWLACVHPEDQEMLRQTYAEAFRTRLPMGLEFRMRHRSGDYRWVLGSGKPFYDLDGQFAGFLAACDDIHGIRSAERRIRRLTDLYAALSRTNHAIIHVDDRQHLFQEVCRIAVDSGKFRLAWITIADPDRGGFHPVAHAGPASAYLEGMGGCTTAADSGGLGLDEVVIRDAAPRIERDLPGSAPCPSCRTNAARNGLKAQAAFPLRVDGRIEGTFSVFSEAEDAFDQDMIALLEEMAQDISFALGHLAREEQRKAAERALAVALQSRQAMLEAASVAKVVPWSMDPDGTLRWGDSAGTVLGRPPEALASRPGWPWHLLLEEDRPRLRQAVHEAEIGLVTSAECRMHRGEGGLIWTRWTLAREGAGYRGAVQDITEQHTVQEQLVQSQKLESLGTLVGGIAHDFNNLLMAILGYCEIFEGDPSFTPRQRKGLEVIHRAAHRGRDLVDRLLGFSRRVAPRRERGNLNTVLSEAASLLVHALSNRLRLQQEPAPGLPDASFDSGQMHQVVMNLAINARDAIEGEGTITLRSGVATVSPETALAHRRLPGDYVFLEVEDTGCGIPPDRLRRIFEPFYSTKGTKGTGLGLSMVHGIVTEHGGFVTCDSRVGVGTRIRVLLPLGQPLGSPEEAGEIGGPAMEVLLVCGEPTRSRLAAGLAQMGHHIAPEASAAEAVAAERPAWDLLVMDPSGLGQEPGAFLDALSRQGWSGAFVLVGPGRPGDLPRPATGCLSLDFTFMELIETLHLSFPP